MKWTSEQTLSTAEQTPSLSALLMHEDLFREDALRWLKKEHINKFIEAIDGEEARKLRQFAYGWYYPNKSNTAGFPLCDWLWVIGPSYDWQCNNLHISSEAGQGRHLVARLAEFESDWIGSWWKWCSKSKFTANDEVLCRIFIDTLSHNDLESHLPELDEGVLADIINRRGDLLDTLPKERWGRILNLALDNENYLDTFVAVLSSCGIPSDAEAIIDELIDSSRTLSKNPLDLLNELVEKWQGPNGSDPVARMVVERHERLDEVLRSFWNRCRYPSQKEGHISWDDAFSWGAPNAIKTAAQASFSYFRLELGFSVGKRIAEDGKEPSKEEVSKKLSKLGFDTLTELINPIFPMAELWAILRSLAIYEKKSWEHKTELVGLRAKLRSLAISGPYLWAEALPWILIRASEFKGIEEAITLELASTSIEVRNALERAGAEEEETIRLKAQGLITLLDGFEDPDSGLVRTLADAAARHLDGIPIFPHPLKPVSATWLCSAGIERTIADGVRRACDRFAKEAREQGGDNEEPLTKALVKEIEFEFRDVQPRLKLFSASGSPSLAPVLSVRQRPVSKTIEEPVYGCDIAWILNGTVRGRYKATWVELVQVKKSAALQFHPKRKHITDSWRIDCKQLNDLLKWSATSAYWLIASAGEILVIPAKHLEAVRRGTEKHPDQKTFRVGYHEIRSAAIPLEQYLVELLIGQWVGTSSEDIVQFAMGENVHIQPRLVVEVTISVGRGDQ